jgi:hypothetical protein
LTWVYWWITSCCRIPTWTCHSNWSWSLRCLIKLTRWPGNAWVRYRASQRRKSWWLCRSLSWWR